MKVAGCRNLHGRHFISTDRHVFTLTPQSPRTKHVTGYRVARHDAQNTVCETASWSFLSLKLPHLLVVYCSFLVPSSVYFLI